MGYLEYRKNVFDILGFTPTDAQWPIFNSTARIRQIAGGWRGGKSEVGSMLATLQAPLFNNGLIWIIGPTYDTPRNSEFEYTGQKLAKLHLLNMEKDYHRPEQGPCTMTIKNKAQGIYCKIVTRSAVDPEKIGMEAPDYILVVEAAQISLDVFKRIRGRAIEKRSKIDLTGTFEEHENSRWYAEQFFNWAVPNEDDAQSFSLPSWSNTVVFPPEDYDIVLANGDIVRGVNKEIYDVWKTESPDIFLEKYGGIPCKPSHLVIPEFNPEKHVGKFPYDPDLPVEIAVDPGYAFPGAYAVLAIQRKEGVLYLVDEIYVQDCTTEDIILMMEQRPWGLNVHRGVIDVASKQHQANKPVIDVWRESSKNHIHLDCRYVHENETINRLKTYFAIDQITKRAKVLVNHSCKGLIAECGAGISPVNGGGAWKRNPNTHEPIDRNNHSLKAFGYFLINMFGYVDRQDDNWGKVYKPERPRRDKVWI